jgi:creatinine amidohydrolase
MLRSSLLALTLLIFLAAPLLSQTGTPELDEVRPIPAADRVFTEDLTWMEIRDAIEGGKTTAIIATGGLEQNGPYLVTAKHNVILRATTEAIARELGNALVAPIVPFVPEGEIDPPSGHMRYPGTISVRAETFHALLTDIAMSLKTNGFQNVILIGDSGGNQDGMALVAQELSEAWEGTGTRIHFIPEYYDNPRWNEWLVGEGVVEVSEGLHDDVRHSSIMALVDPASIRTDQRRQTGLFSINGVTLDPLDQTVELAQRLVDYQAKVTAEAIRTAIGGR